MTTSTANPFAAGRTTKTAAKRTATPAASRPAPDGIEAAPGEAPPKTTAKKPSGDPFGMPSGPGSGEKIQDYVGYLMLVKPTDYIEEMTTDIGTTDVVRADVVLLDGEEQGKLMDGVLVFNMALKRDLIRIIDGPNSLLLGRLGKGVAKKGKSAPFIFESPDEDDQTLARQYLAAQA